MKDLKNMRSTQMYAYVCVLKEENGFKRWDTQ